MSYILKIYILNNTEAFLLNNILPKELLMFLYIFFIYNIKYFYLYVLCSTSSIFNFPNQKETKIS